jgi:glycosyltransferase involved in cell wall biosynthesis
MDGIVKSWNISEEKLKVIYDAPEIINSKSLKETIKKKLNLSGKIILTLSKGSSLKELLEFIELMPKIIENESSARLVISSEPAYKSTLFSKIKELGLEHRIDIIGKIYGKDFTEYIRAADVFVTHASYGKLPTELYVTMNLGTPIITTDLGLDHEIMQPGKTHVYMDKSDKNMLVLAILELINERAISYMFAKAAKKSVSNHTHEHMLEKILQEFRSLSK